VHIYKPLVAQLLEADMPELNREIIFMLELKQEKPFVCSYASKASNI